VFPAAGRKARGTVGPALPAGVSQQHPPASQRPARRPGLRVPRARRARPGPTSASAPDRPDRMAQPPASALAERTSAQPVAHSVPSLDVEPVQCKKGERFYRALDSNLSDFSRSKLESHYTVRITPAFR
jgi:hypothetical protein